MSGGEPGNERRYAALTETYRSFVRYQLSRYQQDRSWRARWGRLAYRARYQFLSHYFQPAPAWRLWLRSLGGARTYPDFACVGAAKSGTSDVSVCLIQHPAILSPLTKEMPEVERRTWVPQLPTLRERRAAERRWGRVACGIFASRLHQAMYLEEFRAASPDPRVVVVLRDPVDRAYSHYKWDLFLGGRTLDAYPFYESFGTYVENALSLFPGTTLPSRCGHPLLASGIYVNSVRMWLERFGRERVYLLKAEEFFRDPAAAVCGIQEFLGLPSIPPPHTEVVLRNPLAVAPPEPETLRQLSAFYRPWNEELYEVAGRDLEWK